MIALSRAGAEPWGKVTQKFRTAELDNLVGKTLEYSIDVKGEFTGEYGEPIEPTAITVQVCAVKKGKPAMMGSSSLLFYREPVAETLGLAPWRRYRVQFEVPAPEQARVVGVELSIVMSMGGTLWARNPALVEVTEQSAD